MKSVRTRDRNPPAGHFNPQQPRSMKRSYVPDEIQDINRELQLLRQKKQMMEEQQRMLECADLYDSQSYYEPAPYDSAGPSWSAEETADYIPFGRGKKRPRYSRDGGPSSEHFSGSDDTYVEQRFGTRLGPKPRRPQPRMPVPKVSPAVVKQEPPSKRTARSSNFAAKKLQNVPSDGNKQAIVKAEPTEQYVEEHTLRADRTPSTSLNGLLELALGSVLKEIKLHYVNSQLYSSILTREYYVRRLKRFLRSRIRTIMMDQYVPNFGHVVDEYRNKFPKNTDTELLDLVKEGEHDPHSDNAVVPELKSAKACQTFFKKNLRKVVAITLKDMFQKITDMYNEEVVEAETAVVSSDDVANVEENEAKKEKKTPPKWNIDLGEMIDKRFFSRFGNYLPIISKIIYADPDFKREHAELMATTIERDPTMPSDVTANIKQEKKPQAAVVTSKPERYVAAVRGTPQLPQRNTMRPFLNKYHPKFIKTHKKIPNLLIVTFNNKDKFDNFLLQNGVTVGDSTLEIKVGGKLVQNPVQAQSNDNGDGGDKKTESQALNESNDTIISSEMDGQINDFLSSLWQGDEEEEIENDEGNTEPDPDANDTEKNGNEIESKEKNEGCGELDKKDNGVTDNTEGKVEKTTQDNSVAVKGIAEEKEGTEDQNAKDVKETSSEINEEVK